MKTTSAVVALGALLSTVSAAPAAMTLFSIKTTSTDSRFNNLCAFSYHTGAGTGDAVLSACTDSAREYYQNGNAIESKKVFGNGVIAGVQAQLGTTYDNWYPVAINAGDGTQNLVYSSTDGFKQKSTGNGFIACRWAHNLAPQLFVLQYSNADTHLPANCAFVNVVKG